jgi:hypothetical protein
MDEYKQALKDLVAAIDRCMPTWDTLALLAGNHGLHYPPEIMSIENELRVARDLLNKE